MTELIGEEIYDEFDPHHEGAQLSTFIPPDSDGGATITTVGANEPGYGHMDSLVLPTSHDTHTSIGSGLGLGHGLTIAKPIAVRAMEGFGLLTSRSRSAPPIRREQPGKQPSSKSGVTPEAGDNNNEGPKVPVISGIDEGTDGPHLDLPTHQTNLIPIPGTEPPQQPRSQPQTPKLDSTIAHDSSHSSHLAVATPPRIASPSSLEAYFLERKRRGVAGGGAIPRIVTPSPGGKGKGFKSSPLSPTEKDITDGVKSKGTSSVTREGDGSDLPSETVMEGKSD